jgi:predicted nucleic acid-binding protein
MRTARSAELDARARLALEQVVMRVSVDLDAAAELLDLSERAERPVLAELALEELAWVSMRSGARTSEREIPVRLRTERDDCVLRADPHVFKRLVAYAVARLHAGGASGVTLRVACEPKVARVELLPTTDADAPLKPTPTRLVRRIPPTDAIVAAAAASVGIDATEAPGQVVLGVPRVA